MAITLLPEPTTGAPYTGDYDNQNDLIYANEVPNLSFLTDWESTTTAPLLKEGVYIFSGANTYVVDTSDEIISGTLSQGMNYIKLVLSGSVLTAEWTTDISDIEYNTCYGIIESGDDLILSDICYLDGTDYIRGRSYGMDFNNIYLANGDEVLSSLNSNSITNSGMIENYGNINNNGALTCDMLTINNAPYPASITVPANGNILVNVVGWIVFGYSLTIIIYEELSERRTMDAAIGESTGGMIYSNGSNLRLYNNQSVSIIQDITVYS